MNPYEFNSLIYPILDGTSSSSEDEDETILDLHSNSNSDGSDSDSDLDSQGSVSLDFSIGGFDEDVIDNDNIFHFYEICELEEDFIDSDKHDGQYVIGLIGGVINNKFVDIFASGVTPSTFFKFSYISILYYLVYSSIFYINGPKKIDIIKIHINSDNVYVSIVKTYWLRLIQRHWKRAYSERSAIIKLRGLPCNIYYFQYRGKYPDGLKNLPGLVGLLSCYLSNVSKYKN
jgi:hypothetical protein